MFGFFGVITVGFSRDLASMDETRSRSSHLRHGDLTEHRFRPFLPPIFSRLSHRPLMEWCHGPRGTVLYGAVRSGGRTSRD